MRTAEARRAAVPRLLAAGVLAPAEVVDRGVVVTDVSRANRVHLVHVGGPDGGGAAVKSLGAEAEGGLDAELRVHALAAERPGLRAALPRLLAEDRAAGWLALELVSPGETLTAAHREAIGYPLDLAQAAGRALRAAHDATRDLAGIPPAPLPWALSALDPMGPAAFAWEEAPLRAVLDGIAEPERHRAALAEARADWRPACLMHGDLKWDNCLVARPVRAAACTVRIIDWEGAGAGDPAWDVAGLVQEYLAYAALMVLDAGGAVRPDALHRALEPVAAAVRALLGAYGADASWVERSMRFAGARLVQTSLEHASRGAAGDRAAAVTLMRLALPLLEAPAAAAALLDEAGAA